MNKFTFESGVATRLGNGTAAVIKGEAEIGVGVGAEFSVVLSSSDKYRHCDGFCTLKLNLNKRLTMRVEDFLRLRDVEEAISLTAIAAYRDWLDGTDSVLDGILTFTDRETLITQL